MSLCNEVRLRAGGRNLHGKWYKAPGYVKGP